MTLDLENVKAVFVAHDQAEVERFSKINDFLVAVLSFEKELRDMWKYGDPDSTFKEPSEVVEWCRSKFYTCLNQNNIDLDAF